MTDEYKDVPIPPAADDTPELATARAVAAREAWRKAGLAGEAMRPELQYLQRRYDEARVAHDEAREAVRLAEAVHAKAVLEAFERNAVMRAASEPLAKMSERARMNDEFSQRARSDYMRQQSELWTRFQRAVAE